MINSATLQARTGSAVQLATTTAIAQMALFHIAAAISEAASKDFKDPNTKPMTSGSDSNESIKYIVDHEQGTGQIVRMQNGKHAADLNFSFEHERTNAGEAYAVTSITGHFEGYQLLFSKLNLHYSALLGDNFKPVMHEDGSYLTNVTIDASGYFGVSEKITARLVRAKISLTYPISDRTLKIGEINSSGKNNSSFDGEVFLESKSIKLKGAIKDVSGVVVYELNTSEQGTVELLEPTASIQPVVSDRPGSPL